MSLPHISPPTHDGIPMHDDGAVLKPRMPRLHRSKHRLVKKFLVILFHYKLKNNRYTQQTLQNVQNVQTSNLKKHVPVDKLVILPMLL